MAADDALKKFLSELIAGEKQLMGPVAVTVARQAGVSFSENQEPFFEGDGEKVAETVVSKFHDMEGPVAYTIAKKALEKTRELFPEFSLPGAVTGQGA